MPNEIPTQSEQFSDKVSTAKIKFDNTEPLQRVFRRTYSLARSQSESLFRGSGGKDVIEEVTSNLDAGLDQIFAMEYEHLFDLKWHDSVWITQTVSHTLHRHRITLKKELKIHPLSAQPSILSDARPPSSCVYVPASQQGIAQEKIRSLEVVFERQRGGYAVAPRAAPFCPIGHWRRAVKNGNPLRPRQSVAADQLPP